LPREAKPYGRLFNLYSVVALLFLLSIFPLARGDPGNAGVSRTLNLQCFEMTPSIHPPGNAAVTRFRNLQCFEMTPPVHPPGDLYVSRLRNLQCFEMTPQIHPPGDVYISRIRNLQIFEMIPQAHPSGDAFITRVKNLQCFEMAYQIHEIKTNITYIATTDQSGNQTTNFMKGDVVQINFTIHNTGVPLANGLISIVITNPSDNMVFLSYTFKDFSIGTSESFIFGYRIPQDAPEGIYTVKVMVFTDWPSEGGVGLDVKIATFNVI